MADDLYDEPGNAQSEEQPSQGQGVEKNYGHVLENQYRPLSSYRNRLGNNGKSGSDKRSGALGRSGLRNAESTGGGGAAAGGSKSVSPGGLASSEKSAGGGLGSLFNPDDKGGRFQRFKGHVGNFSKNRWLKISAMGGGVVVIIIILLILIIGSLKLPDVMQHITGYEFARVTRQFSESAQSTTDEALAVEAANDGTYAALKDKYQGLRDNTWGKLDQYRPNKVIENLGESNNLELRYKTSKLTGRQIFVGGSINGQEFTVEQVSGVSKWTPGVNQIVKFKNQLAFNQSGFFQAVTEAQKANDIHVLVRGQVFRTLLKDTGGSLRGYLLSKFTSTNAITNEAEAALDTYNATEAGPKTADNAVTQQVAEADQAVADATKEDSQNINKVKEIVANDGIDPAAQAAADAKLDPSFGTQALGVANPIYAAAVPICIVYDGSVQQSKPAIENQTKQQQNAFNNLAARADEQKAGGPPDGSGNAGELATAISATNDQIGDISQSIPETRAAGGNVNTSSIPSAEAGAGGSFDYSIFNALGVPSGSPEGLFINWAFGNACPVLTNLFVAGGIGLANIALAIVTLGSSQAAEEAAGQAASEGVSIYVKTLVQNAFQQLFAKQVVKNGVKTVERGFLNRAMRFTFKQGLIVGATVGATEFAHLIVAARSGEANNGFAQNTDLVNEADSGANIRAGEYSRQGQFGRPMLKDEVAQSDQQDTQTLADQNRSRSFTDRYFAFSNADSLVSHVGLDLDRNVRGGIMASILQVATSLFKPMGSLATVVGSVSGSARAAPDPSTTHYGNVQFGWSEQEKNLINSSDSYKSLPNRAILDASGQEAAIAQKYAKCFGYSADSNGNLTPDPNGDSSLGSLLSNGDITRDSDGNVTDSGDCSPSKLGPGNNTYGKHMVFRWRLAHRFNKTVEQLTDEQELTTVDQAAGGGSVGGVPSGDAQQLAQQILDAAQQGKISFDHEWDAYGDATDGSAPLQNMQETARGQPAKTTSNCSGRGAQPPQASVSLDPKLLRFILELSQQEHFTINALAGECHGSSGSNHYQGKAVDIGCPFNPGPADSVGSRYGISDGTGETCGNAGHYHYSIGGH